MNVVKFTKRLWRFSLTVNLCSRVQKGYLAYDSQRSHMCLHIGRKQGKWSADFSNYPVYQGIPYKPRRKELHV